MTMQPEDHMLTATLKRDLEITLEHALLMADPETTVPELAQRLYDSQRDLIQQCERIWTLERLRWMLYRKKQRVANKNQLRLPGFENLPRLITMEDGRRRNLQNATLRDLKEYRLVLLKNNSDKVAVLDRLIALVSKHSRKRRVITVHEAIEAETGGSI